MNEGVDLLDRGPRLKRLALSLVVAIAVTVAVGALCLQLVGHDADGAGYFDGGHAARAWKFVFYIGGLAGVASFIVTLKTLAWRARKLAARPPEARVVRT